MTGSMRSILSAERVGLNYLQRMSGIATYTHQVVSLLEGTGMTLVDTRKTTPNMRVFEKYAVTVGGGKNHRYNLSDGVLLKDNHISAAGGVAKAIAMAKAYAPFVRKIEVETETLDMVREAVEAGADIIAGSLIKNPGGGIAPTGGYIAGKEELVHAAADYLTAPGLGDELGSYAAGYRLFFQGFFMAPHVTAQAIKGAVFAAAVFEKMASRFRRPSRIRAST